MEPARDMELAAYMGTDQLGGTVRSPVGTTQGWVGLGREGLREAW